MKMVLLNDKLKRKKGGRHLNKVYVIFCEGKSEENYFKYLGHKNNKTVRCFQLQHKDFLGIANEIIINKRNNGISDNDFVFCVIDKDNHSVSDYEDGSKQIEKNAKIIFSSKSFEVWILMHFSRFEKLVYKVDDYKSLINDNPNNRKYFKLKGINGEVWKPYSNEVWNALSDKVQDAINNAKYISGKQIKESEHNDKFECEPYTDIWYLVKELIKSS